MPDDSLYRECADILARHDQATSDELFAAFAFRANVDHAVRAGREQAAADIRARADRVPGTANAVSRAWRRALLAAARIAAGPPTMAEVAQALADGHAVWCNLDDAGRAIEPDSARLMRSRFPRRVGGGTVEIATDAPNEAPSAAQKRPTGVDADTEPHGAATEAPRGAETIAAHRVEFAGIDNDINPGAYTARCSCGHTTISIHGLDHVLEILQRHIEHMDAVQEASRG